MSQILSNKEYAEAIDRLAGETAPDFQPHAYYDTDGDCIEFFAKPEPFVAERVDALVTVYYGQESGEIVGSLVKGVKRFCNELFKKLPGFKIEIQSGNIKLVHIFQAGLWSAAVSPHDLPTLATYRKLMQVAEEKDVEIEDMECLV